MDRKEIAKVTTYFLFTFIFLYARSILWTLIFFVFAYFYAPYIEALSVPQGQEKLDFLFRKIGFGFIKNELIYYLTIIDLLLIILIASLRRNNLFTQRHKNLFLIRDVFVKPKFIFCVFGLAFLIFCGLGIYFGESEIFYIDIFTYFIMWSCLFATLFFMFDRYEKHWLERSWILRDAEEILFEFDHKLLNRQK